MKNKKDMFKPYEEEREKIALKLSQDIPFIDPYYYQFYVEALLKAQEWATKEIEVMKNKGVDKEWLNCQILGINYGMQLTEDEAEVLHKEELHKFY